MAQTNVMGMLYVVALPEHYERLDTRDAPTVCHCQGLEDLVVPA
jgi:hypothetical protein